MKHWETHPEYVEGCNPCRWATVGVSTATITQERRGGGPMGDSGTRAYVNKMFADRRRDGLSDPVPTTAEARKFMPAAGVAGNTKEYKKANGGL
jgi:hypothetical protein